MIWTINILRVKNCVAVNEAINSPEKTCRIKIVCWCRFEVANRTIIPCTKTTKITPSVFELMRNDLKSFLSKNINM